MTIHFIGAGPGAPDLITVRGRDLVMSCPVCLYAGSLVPKEIVALAPAGARVIDTAPLDLDEIEAELVAAHEAGLSVARLHSGDLSLWSALGEQLRRLDKRGIPFTVTPGVPAFAASAAALAQELTLPGLTQSVVLTRTSGRASAMPESETLEHFAASGATMAIHLSVHVLGSVVARIMPAYGPDCPVAVVYRASWPDQQVVRGTLSTIVELMQQTKVEAREPSPSGSVVAERRIDSTATILVGAVLGARDFRESALYSTDYQRRFRGRE
jgi:precorrin-4/cobalt-precorrin-4 C11-methyltransferase